MQRLTTSPHNQSPGSWHPSGKYIAFDQQGGANPDIWILPMEGNEASGWKPGQPTVFLSTNANERVPMFSPDGRWLAYASNESGSFEVYVRAFPGPGGPWQISSGGGDFPVWSRSKAELFFTTLDQQIMVASYRVDGDAFLRDQPRPWSEKRYLRRPGRRSFDLHPDGARVALAPRAEAPGAKQDHVVFVFNFFDELRRLVPVKP